MTVRELERFNVATVDLDAVIMSRLEAITAGVSRRCKCS